jgi:DNA-binding NtrC family response regulator
MHKRLLIISLGNMLPELCTHDTFPQWNVARVSTLSEAERELSESPYLVGLLVHDQVPEHLDELKPFLHRHRSIHWVAIFERSDLESVACRDLITDYLSDYHTIPVDFDRLSDTLGHVLGVAALKRPVSLDRIQKAKNASTLVGNCAAMVRLRHDVKRVAKVEAPVLIWGPSGSGKELTAQAIHAQSKRAKGPFVPINCGAISSNLIHTELFGYERGAFTGATQGKQGLIESANGGTLFLDEIGDLPKELQTHFLRFLQEGSICRLGSVRSLRIDVRVLAASHVRLEDAVMKGAFREDLFHRLAVLPVTVPPLRERRDDLCMLAEHFFDLFAHEGSHRLRGFSDSAMRAIIKHDWPGNVRELINCVRRAVVMAEGDLITSYDLGLGTWLDRNRPPAEKPRQSYGNDCATLRVPR